MSRHGSRLKAGMTKLGCRRLMFLRSFHREWRVRAASENPPPKEIFSPRFSPPAYCPHRRPTERARMIIGIVRWAKGRHPWRCGVRDGASSGEGSARTTLCSRRTVPTRRGLWIGPLERPARGVKIRQRMGPRQRAAEAAKLKGGVRKLAPLEGRGCRIAAGVSRQRGAAEAETAGHSVQGVGQTPCGMPEADRMT